MDEAEKFIYKKEGKKYLTFEISELQKEDEYGRSHTCYLTSVESDKKAEKASEPTQVYPKVVADKIKSGQLKKIGTMTKKTTGKKIGAAKS